MLNKSRCGKEKRERKKEIMKERQREKKERKKERKKEKKKERKKERKKGREGDRDFFRLRTQKRHPIPRFKGDLFWAIWRCMYLYEYNNQEYICYSGDIFTDVGGPLEEIKATEAPNSEAIGSIAILLMCTLPVLIVALDLLSICIWIMEKLDSLTRRKNEVMHIRNISTR